MDCLPLELLLLILQQLALDSEKATIWELRRISLVNKTFSELC